MGLILIIFIAGIAFLVVLAILFFGLYNGLVRARIGSETAWSDIDVQLKRRHDLIPNLVNSVKGYAAHEKETLENVVQARNNAVSANGVAETGQAEGMLSSALGKLFALSESYPDLKANQNFLQLQEELTATEGRVAYARQFYNDSVLTYNNKIESVPTNVLAKMLNFGRREYFEADEAARTVPDVNF